jgi:hypothetical protein
MSTLTRRLFNVDDDQRRAEAGILLADDRAELIEGELIEMAAIGAGGTTDTGDWFPT